MIDTILRYDFFNDFNDFENSIKHSILNISVYIIYHRTSDLIIYIDI